jgi:hypothetical protein
MDGYITPPEQMINNLTLNCPNTPLRPVFRPEFLEPLDSVKLALPMTRPTKGGLTLKGYASPVQKK